MRTPTLDTLRPPICSPRPQCGTCRPAPTLRPTTLRPAAPTALRACGAPTARSRCACLWVRCLAGVRNCKWQPVFAAKLLLFSAARSRCACLWVSGWRPLAGHLLSRTVLPCLPSYSTGCACSLLTCLTWLHWHAACVCRLCPSLPGRGWMPTEIAWLLRFVSAPTRLPPNCTTAGHTSDVDMVRWHPNCHYIASGSSDRTVRLWDVRTGECARLLVGHKDRVRLGFMYRKVCPALLVC